MSAQPVPTAASATDDPATISKYDTNKDGTLDAAERAAMEADQRRAASVPVQPAASGTPQDEELITLSPFEVVGEATGYYQPNVMSGTRLGTKIEDLAQSITVMTKEQMSDFAMLDINDVFDYMAGTEGTNTFSDFVLDRTGAVTDNITFDPNNANRVRGIGKANIAFNNIAMSGRVPVDPLWMDSLELSRGPNANIFGLGEASGTVNQVPSTANLSRDFTQVSTRVDSYGGWRGSIDFNKVFYQDALALRASYSYQHTAFERKPSGENARRLSLQAKIKPFKYTTLSVSWYGYNNASRRPNFTTPRDNITGWLAAGQPAWDPTTRLITLNGVTYGRGTGNTVIAGSTTAIPDAALPSYFSSSPSDGRSIFRVGGPGEDPYWAIPTITNATTPAANGVGNNIRFLRSGFVNNYGTSQPLFASYAALGDKSIYDWEKISLTAPNKAWDDVDTVMAQLDQIFINSSRQQLAAQATFMREDASRIEDLPLGPASVNGVIGEIYADPNIRNLDGTPNPYFGRPYLRSKEPFLRDKPLLWETTRAQAAYKFDFSRDDGWSKWLGTHQLLGYYEYKDQQAYHYAWRRTATSRVHPWEISEFNRNAPLGNRTTGGNDYQASHNHMRVYEFYYLGDTPGGGVEYAPQLFPEGATVPFVWGNTGNFRYDPATIGYTPAPDGSTGTSSKQTIIKTYGGVLQSTFFDGRLVTTFGSREDKVSDRNKVNTTLTPDLMDIDYAVSNEWQDSSTWRLAQGKTTTSGVVLRPFRDLGFLRDQVNGGSPIGRFFGEAFSSLGLTYNKSDNFIPQGPAVDLFLRPLPNQTGHTKELGFWMTLFDGKVSLRYNHFETLQKNKRDGDINTIAQRTLRADGILNTNNHDSHNLQDRSTDWVTQLNPGWSTDQIRAEVEKIMGLSYEFMDAMEAAGDQGRIAATQDVEAKGDELELNYTNTDRTWTVSASITSTETINKNAGSTVEDWLNTRLPIWNAVEDLRYTADDDPNGTIPTGATDHLLWRYIAGSAFTTPAPNYHSTTSALANYAVFVEGPVAVFRQLEGRPRPQLAKYTGKFSTRYNLSGISDNSVLKNMTVGGSVRWIDKKSINFLGAGYDPATFPTVKILALDPNRPVYTPAETYVDLWVSYRTRLFDDKIRATFQLNAKNITESGGDLLVTNVFPDGSPLAYRIIDPRQFIFSMTFDF